MNRIAVRFGPEVGKKLSHVESLPEMRKKLAGEQSISCGHLALPGPLRELLQMCDCLLSLPNTVQDRQATSMQACLFGFFPVPLSRNKD